ncbi:MBL fold metallo-hydrolase [Anoxynatronum buryatiense]|uniref:Phosphoribosyl 1,2-cyclic phosphodiesterase n=1 Tax=Anoxynatronum buryatiense TaxID=489973 RepID=A0AA45WWB8_9CLOT|nr:MBL fold metallo-hydrolase [Anoxynatronum buryatiense]SMP58726.1 Phosphoribosyl 1,2-cyclic phosphodiesterase [Anoxynatronum buryatiense]
METLFCTLASGSSGNCHLLSNNGEALLIDAGLSGKQIQQRLTDVSVDPARLTGILISHEHQDHIQGAGILSRRFDLPIYANAATWEAMAPKLGNIKPEHQRIFDSKKPFAVGSIGITPYHLSHDAAEPVGFVMETGKVKVCIATDLGQIPTTLMKTVENADLVIMESNHDVDMLQVGHYPYPLKRRILSDLGHLSNEAAGMAVVDMVRNNVKSVLLAHLSRENNFPALALSTVTGILAENGMVPGRDLELNLSVREHVSCLYRFATGT